MVWIFPIRLYTTNRTAREDETGLTAEIVIMNKHGLSLAADSAITSGQDGVRKVYNSANKLFSLSEQHPVGIMVYGSASFMEVPWGVIIKTFRDTLEEECFPNLTDYMNLFLEFLQEEKKYNHQKIEEIIVYRTFSDILKQIVKEVEEKMSIQHVKGYETSNVQVVNWMLDCVQRNIKYYEQTD